jgi:nucleotide-binding universal stress UspA family protein
MFERILFPLDFSEPSLRMLKCVKELKGFGLKEVVLCHVAASGISLTSDHRETLEGIKESIRQVGCEVREVVTEGDPVEQVLDIAESEDVSLIAMASSGKGRTQELLIGSTSFGILRSTSRPVLINKFPEVEDELRSAEPSPIFQKALIPIDFSSCTDMCMMLLPELSSRGLREAVLFNVVESGSSNIQEGKRFQKVLNKVMLDLDEMRSKLEGRGCRVSTHVHFGTVPYNILEASRELDASVIILGAHRKSLLREITLGGNSETVVRRSTIPLLVIPCD